MTWILTKRILPKRGLIAAVVMAAVALFGSVTPASAATGPYGFTILHADAGNGAHHCGVLATGIDTGTGTVVEAIVCVDIDTSGSGSVYRATGAIEAFCSIPNGATVRCGSISVHAFFANASSGAADFNWSCSGSSCSTGRNIIYGSSVNYNGTSNCTSNPANDVWTTALGNTSIELPNTSDLVVGTVWPAIYNDGTGYSSGHYWVCP